MLTRILPYVKMADLREETGAVQSLSLEDEKEEWDTDTDSLMDTDDEGNDGTNHWNSWRRSGDTI